MNTITANELKTHLYIVAAEWKAEKPALQGKKKLNLPYQSIC
jgi:hypothetical protein